MKTALKIRSFSKLASVIKPFIMKYSAQICTKAIEFALTKNAVRTVLGPIDSNPGTNIRQVTAHLIDAQENSAKVEIIFDYTSPDGSDTVPNVHVFLSWFKGAVGFTLDEVKTSNP
jgi:hypothetical protein